MLFMPYTRAREIYHDQGLAVLILHTIAAAFVWPFYWGYHFFGRGGDYSGGVPRVHRVSHIPR